MIILNAVSKSYVKNQFILKNLSLEINKGSFCLVKGPSGSGKTTLLNLIAGFDRPTSGFVEIKNVQINKLAYSSLNSYRQKISFVFQDLKLLEKKSVFENVSLALEVNENKNYDEKIKLALNEMELGDKKNTLVEELSGGEKQRVAFARAIVREPEILILDEPTGNLDEKMSVKVLKILDQLYQKNTTIILATHDSFLMNSLDCQTIDLGKLHV